METASERFRVAEIAERKPAQARENAALGPAVTETGEPVSEVGGVEDGDRADRHGANLAERQALTKFGYDLVEQKRGALGKRILSLFNPSARWRLVPGT